MYFWGVLLQTEAQRSALCTYGWLWTVGWKAGVPTCCPTFTVLEEYQVWKGSLWLNSGSPVQGDLRSSAVGRRACRPEAAAPRRDTGGSPGETTGLCWAPGRWLGAVASASWQQNCKTCCIYQCEKYSSHPSPSSRRYWITVSQKIFWGLFSKARWLLDEENWKLLFQTTM